MISNKHRIAPMWAVALTLYAACWFLPIIESDRGAIGYHGAKFAHTLFLEQFGSFAAKLKGPADLFGTVFISIGWLANELFVLGVATVWKWPRFAVRFLAFSLGIMISWQVAFLDEFPLFIGYWLWIAAGVIALWLCAERLARQPKSSVVSVLADKVTLSLLLFPILNAAAGSTLDAIN